MTPNHLYQLGNWSDAVSQGDESTTPPPKNRDPQIIGQLGATLSILQSIDIDSPPGLIIGHEIADYFREHQAYPDGFTKQVKKAIHQFCREAGGRFGRADADKSDESEKIQPVLLSVRMSLPNARANNRPPYVLNIGMNDAVADQLARVTGNDRFAFDCYRRFLHGYGTTVMGVDSDDFFASYTRLREKLELSPNERLGADQLKTLCARYKDLIRQEAGETIEQDPMTQLWGIIGYCLASDFNQPSIIIQTMVYGNLDDRSGAGFVFTRDPQDGQKNPTGGYMKNAQGPDLSRPRYPLFHISSDQSVTDKSYSMQSRVPGAYEQLQDIIQALEHYFRDMQRIEFVVQSGQVYILDSRTGDRTPEAAIRIATEMVDDDIIGRSEAARRIPPSQIKGLIAPTVDNRADQPIIARGQPVTGGIAIGKISFDKGEVIAKSQRGEPVIFVTDHTKPSDTAALRAADGIIDLSGDRRSHAALVARSLSIPCILHIPDLSINHDGQKLIGSGHEFAAGDVITIDGLSGDIMGGSLQIQQADLSDDLLRLMAWADERRRLKIYTNVVGGSDLDTARHFGAEGVGLLPIEHIIAHRHRLMDHLRQAMLTNDDRIRSNNLESFSILLRDHLVDLFDRVGRRPVFIRLIDAPIFDFLPKQPKDIQRTADDLDMSAGECKRRIDDFRPVNPILGHRGARLAISHPDILAAQVNAIRLAQKKQLNTRGEAASAQIVIPMMVSGTEVAYLRQKIEELYADGQTKDDISLHLAAMIELPQACFAAGRIAEQVDTLLFETHDLTQTALGLSRDDAHHFLDIYRHHGIFDHNPFTQLDRQRIGEFVITGVERARDKNPEISLGLIGRHAGRPETIHFAEYLGFDFISCQSDEVPIARLAAAQASLDHDIMDTGEVSDIEDTY